MTDKIKRKGFKENKSLYQLNLDTIEAWQQNAGLENRKLIRHWAQKNAELKEVQRELKELKGEIAEQLQEQKEQGVKVTEKFLAAMIDANETVQAVRSKRDELEVTVAELYQVLLLYRDMWNASPTIRQESTMLMRHAMNEER